MSQTGYIRDDQADIRLYVDGVEFGDGNSWCDYSGAVLKAAGSKTRPGGMGKEKELGGLPTRGDCTITTQNSDAMVAQHPTLEHKVGRGDAQVVVTYLDDYGNVRPNEQFSVYGKLLEAGLPGQKFDSPAVGMYQVVVGADE